MSLTTEQKTFVDCVQSYLDNKNTGIFILNAPAGTGKTFTINYIRKFIRCDRGVVVLAPTHKAASLISAKTIHRFFNAKGDVNDDGDIVFNFDIKKYSIHADIIIVDEASMIGVEMYELFKILSERYLIIFCGDQCQIPPVKEDNSPIFNKKNHTGNTLCFSFTKNMRSKDSLSNHWLQKFRDNIDTRNVVYIDRQSFSDCLTLFNNNQDTVMLAWTNKQVNELNNKIRTYLFKKNKADILNKYYEGETLVFSGYRNTSADIIIDSNPMLFDIKSKIPHFYKEINVSEEDEYDKSDLLVKKYYSSDLFEIKKIYMISLFIPYFICPHQKIDCTKIKKCGDCNLKGHNILGRDIKFHVIEDEKSTIWLSVDDSDESVLKSIMSEYKSYCIHKKNKDIWRVYYRVREILMPEINYKYASTVHKAQGSQWSNVIVDITNLRLCRDIPLNSRLQYTAVSRMQNLVQFF
jgi:hypothetical protein